jgi:hypothetical protein
VLVVTLHLLKDTSNPLALSVLSLQPSSETSAPVVVVLSPGKTTLSLPHAAIYHLQEQPSPQEKNVISYSRLVEILFQAEKVIAW